MNMKTLKLRVLLVATVLAGRAVCTAQFQNEPSPPQLLEKAPATGTFYLLGRIPSPPYPFDPYFGTLPVFAYDGVFFVDDSAVGFLEPSLNSGSEGGGMMLAMSAPGPCNPCSTNGNGLVGTNYSGPPAYSYNPTNVWLEIKGVTNGQAFFTVRTPDSFETFDLFSTTNLTTNVAGLNLTNWLWLTRTVTGQTNLVLTNLWPGEGWFKLGTMLDSDADGLPDAFEILVSKTNPQLRDTDNDGLADGDETGPNGLPWGLEQARRSSVVVYANTPTATEGGGCGQVTVYLPKPAPPGGVTVQYRFGGTALPTTEFTTTPTGNTLTIPSGSSSGTITICAVNDSELVDLDRYVEVTLTNASCCTVDSQPARVTLIDNDLPQVRVFAFPPWVRKPSPTFGTNPAAFYFIRDGDAAGAVTLPFTLSGTAQTDVDFDYFVWSVYFPAGVRTNLLNVVLKPTTNVADKTLILAISGVSGYQIDPSSGAATMTIASSSLTPVPVVQVTATDDDAREPSNSGTFTFTRTGPTTAPLQVFYRVGGTAEAAGVSNNVSDYLELPGVITIPAGQSSATATVAPFDNDDVPETMETVILVLSGGDYKVGTNNQATVFIDDNAVASYNAEVVRPGVHGFSYSAPLYLRVTRNGTALGAASVPWVLTYTFTPNILSTVTAGGNVSGSSVVFAARQTVANATFNTTWSAHPDSPLNVNFMVNGSPPSGYGAYHPQSSVVRLATPGSPATIVNEGATVSTMLSFTRPYPSSGTVIASFAASGSAVEGTDFASLPANVSFPPNSAGPINVSVTATANSQTNGWKTAVVTINSSTAFVGDANYDRVFFRIQDVQASNPVFDTDLDNDGLSDGWELTNIVSGFNLLTPNNAYADTDRDGLQLFEEIQLGTNPNVADAAPVYPSEDPDDYVPLTLLLGAKGKLSELNPGNCATCHSAGLRVGPHTRSTPRTSRDFLNNSQNHLLRFLRGSNYPVRLLDNPTAKVLSSSQTNGTTHHYTAAYTAQFLNANTNAYTFVTDTNQLLGTNRPMVLEALARQATLYVPDLLIAADADRDGIVNTTNRTDRTSANEPFTFWINDDSDSGSDDTAEDLDPSANVLNRSNATIDGLRDLEDFTRLHFRVEGLPGNFLTNANMRTRIYLTNLTGTPSLRLFRTTEANGGAAYLTNESTATFQLALGAYGLLTNGTPLTLLGSEWKSSGSNRFFLPTIFEGFSTGRCVIVFAIASNTGPDIAVSRPFHLELRKAESMYEHWTVGDSHTIPWLQVGTKATNTTDSAVFGAPQRNEQMDYILFVHGWRMQPWERRAFASTSYKRLWQLGYKGRFGFFSWPTEWVSPAGLPFDPQNYDRSERISYWSASGLQRLLVDLNRMYPARVRVMAHSMGNIVVSEALRLKGQNASRPPVIHTYVASQAASVAHAYDAVNPQTTRSDFLTQTPETYAQNPFTGRPYFTGMTNAVRFDPTRNTRNIWNFHNRDDFALGNLSWVVNQDLKPDDGWKFNLANRTWRRNQGHPEGFGQPEFPQNTYEIYAHIAEARSYALGAAERDGFVVRGQIAEQINLNGVPFVYGGGSHEHSAQFLSILMHRNTYWLELMRRFDIAP